jgi:hypothetical protein
VTVTLLTLSTARIGSLTMSFTRCGVARGAGPVSLYISVTYLSLPSTVENLDIPELKDDQKAAQDIKCMQPLPGAKGQMQWSTARLVVTSVSRSVTADIGSSLCHMRKAGGWCENLLLY